MASTKESDFLKAAGLVKEDQEEYDGSFGLTQEGLQLAHNIKTERQRRKSNIILLALTAILTVLTVVLVGVEIHSVLNQMGIFLEYDKPP